MNPILATYVMTLGLSSVAFYLFSSVRQKIQASSILVWIWLFFATDFSMDLKELNMATTVLSHRSE